VEPGFSDLAGQEERAELVSDFAATTAAVMATIDLEDTVTESPKL
jgi:hypothetical protein